MMPVATGEIRQLLVADFQPLQLRDAEVLRTVFPDLTLGQFHAGEDTKRQAVGDGDLRRTGGDLSGELNRETRETREMEKFFAYFAYFAVEKKQRPAVKI